MPSSFRRHPFVLVLALELAGALAGTARAQVCAPVSRILSAYRAAVSRGGWNRTETLELRYRYSGQGMAGEETLRIDTGNGAFVEHYVIGPTTGADGFDGKTAWQRHHSGVVLPEAGGDIRQLAVNEAYRNANAWWRHGRGGAAVQSDGCRKVAGRTYEVLTVTPRGGKRFEAWFDLISHRLSRIVEQQGYKTVTTFYSRYRAAAGMMLPERLIIGDGTGAGDRQTLTLTSARRLPRHSMTAYAPPPNRVDDYRIDDGEASTTVPIELRNGHIFARVWIDGRGPFRFLLDTGGYDIVTPALAATIGLHPAGHAEATGSGTAVAHAGYARVADIRIGRAHIEQQTVIVLHFEPDAVEGFRVDGMLGFETFWRFIARIDYGRRTLTLFEPTSFHAPRRAIAVPFAFYGTVPEVQGSFDGIPGRFDIDTGSRSELDLTRPFVAANHLRERYPDAVLAVTGWGIGGPSRAYVIRGRSLELGAVKIPDLVADLTTQSRGAFADPSYAGNVGSGLLRMFTLTLDYRNRVLYFQRRQPPSACAGTYDRAGMWINQSGSDFRIADVTAGGPAQAAGLEPGDVIVRVDGAPSDTMTLSEFREWLREAPAGSSVKFSVRRHAMARRFAVILRNQIPPRAGPSGACARSAPPRRGSRWRTARF